MVFSSLTFLFFFFSVTFVLYYVCKNRVYRNTILLIASIIFYSWGEPRLIALMLLASAVAYAGGLLMEKFETEQKYKAKKTVFIITVILLVLNLFWFKYLNFAVDNINLLLENDIKIKHIALPIGISFYTFQILSYVIDLYKKEVAVQKNYFYLTLYVTFFPQLIAGPIVRYQTVEEEIHNRYENLDDITEGVKRFIVGLAKKAIIANNVASVAKIIYEGDSAVYGTAMYWVAAIAYTLQIYFDFSGYSDMAIGLGRMFGFHFLENFNYPYIALSITDFWRRWHISLSSWFRDYIYIPLGGNRVGKLRHIFNILAVWTITGFWHGAQWNFVLWGLYYAALLLIEKLLIGKYLEKLPKFFRWCYSMFFVIISWVIFNLTDFARMTNALVMMFNGTPTNFSAMLAANTEIMLSLVYIPLGLVFMFPIYRKKTYTGSVALAVENVVYLALFVLCIVYVISSSYNPFIYYIF